MFHLLGILFLIILVILLIGLAILSRIIGMVFGFKRRMQRNGSASQHAYSSNSNSSQDNTSHTYSSEGNSTVRPRKKIFDKEEGEYVDFEEIK